MPPPYRQLALPLPVADGCDLADLLEDASNAEALAWLRRPESWPAGRLALFGPAATGKTHMLRGLAARRGWPVLPGLTIRGWPAVPAGEGLALDDADCVPEEAALLHLLNLCAERGQRVLLAGRDPPARWAVTLADLRSRLRAMTAVMVHPPGDALLSALLRRHFLLRQLRVERGVQDWLLARLPREAAAVAEAAARLDHAALAAGGRVTRALARAALVELPGFGPDGEEEDAPPFRDDGFTDGPTLL
ncbi:P-loop NTPase family protein [Paracraurococcus lichenis]|uniref:Chromosomal replication initiator DnaA n=1 Tax=Paracraurococcus lichenis TaxID=3064888 RepID=A0ABT9E2U8_9PROT|nr:chromosomal replication initiator DnaA [Paracraurococcus sp. LOR1-02]MDO9710478.1 chromosomal replication initiator DnaA [Paracraurococcus sp. LOR1-02]